MKHNTIKSAPGGTAGLAVRAGALFCAALLLCRTPLRAQTEDFLPRESHLFSGGVTRPASPEAFSLTSRVTDASADLYTGIAGLTVPVYTYSDNDFTIPVSLTYSSSGYRPNIQSGVLGLGWSLAAGGAVTREVRGIMDDAWPDLEMYHFRSRRHGDPSLDDEPTVSVHGYGFLHNVGAVTMVDIDAYDPDDYTDDYVLQGKAGSEYMSVLRYTGSSAADACMFENTPDIFHFSVPGHSGSFILKPGGGAQFFGTSGPAGQYSVEVALERGGFMQFVLTDGMNVRYTFAHVDPCTAWSTCGNYDDLQTCGSWRLTRIDAPDGRYVTLTYGEENWAQTISPVISRETNWRETWKEYHDSEGGSECGEDISYLSHSETRSDCLTRIRVFNAGGAAVCTLDFSYSAKALEAGCETRAARKLDSVTVTNASGTTVRSCTLSYVMDSGRDTYSAAVRGVTFLRSVSIPGEGTWSFEYDGRSGTTFPALGSWQIDWYGFWNPAVGQTSFVPTITYATANAATRPWLASTRQAAPASAVKGMLSSVTWPTGGRSTFTYEANSFSSDRTGMVPSQTHGTASGLRVSRISTFDADGGEVQRRDFSYVGSDGVTSSGRLLWRPEIFCQYDAHSTGYRTISRKVVSSVDDFTWSGRSFIEYPRVLETTSRPGDPAAQHSIVESLFHSADYGEHDFNATPVSSVTLPDGWTYSVSSSLGTAAMTACRNSCRSTSLAGQLMERNEYSGSLSCRVGSRTLTLDEMSDGPALTVPSMLFGFVSAETLFHMSPVPVSVRTREFGSPAHGTAVSDRTEDIGYDDLWRVASVSSGDSRGRTLRTEFSYHAAVPALLTERKTFRDGLQMGGERFTWQRPASSAHPGWYVPQQLQRAAVELIHHEDEGEEPRDETEASWYTVMSFSSFNAAGNPGAVTDALGNVTRWTWDSTLLNPVSMKRFLSGSSGAALTTSWTWIPLVGVTSETLPSGRSVSCTYDTAGRLLTVKNSAGQTTSRYWYNIVSDSANTGSLPASGVSPSASRNFTLTASFRTAAAAAYAVAYDDGLGFLSEEIGVDAGDGCDIVTVHTRDALMRETLSWLPYPEEDNGGAFVSSPGDAQQAWYADLFDEHEHSCSLTEAEACPGGRTTARHIAGSAFFARPSSVRYVAGTVDGRTVRGERTTDGDGRTSTVWTDIEGLTVARDVETGDNLARTLYRHDWRGNVTEVVTPAGNTYTYEYDPRGRMVRRTVPGRAYETFTYDALDRVLTSQDGAQRANGVTVRHTYDALGRETLRSASRAGVTRPLISTAYSAQTGLKTSETLWELTPDGWVSAASSLSRTFQYDAEDRPVQVTETAGDGSRSLVTAFTYDLAGNVLTRTETSTAGGASTTVLTACGYDAHGRPTSGTVSVNGLQKAYVSQTYNTLGQPHVRTFGSGADAILETTSYTLQGWTSSVQGSLLSLSLGYEDGAAPSYTGLITRTQWQHGAGAPSRTVDYTYDDLGRLSGSAMAGQGNRWSERLISYDPDGNILSLDRYQDDGSAPSDRLRFTYTGARRDGWGYDDSGNVVSDPVRGFEFSCNLLNLPCEVTTGPQAAQAEEGETVSTTVFWADGTREGVKDADGRWASRYAGSLIYEGSGGAALDGVVFGDGFIDCGAGAAAATAQYFLRDHLGSVRVVAEDASTVVSRTDYLPFGVRMTGNGLVAGAGRASWFGFTGKENEMFPAVDPATEHWAQGERYQHFGARTYDPFSCTFLQPDPLADSYHPVSPYAYCAGNPVQYRDDFGLDIVLAGANGSSVTFKTDLFDKSVDLGKFGIDWQGNYSFEGDEQLSAALDIAGIFDPWPTADIANATLQYAGGDKVGAAVSLIGVIPGLGDIAKVTRIERDIKVVSDAAKTVSFTSRNFRKNLSRLTGENPAGKQAHHLFPQKFRRFFEEAHINIDDPKFGRWLESKKHDKGSYQYNKKWEEYFDENRNKSEKEYYEQALIFMKEVYEE